MDFSFKVRVTRDIWAFACIISSYPKIHFRLSCVIKMMLTYPRPLRQIHDWLVVFVTRSGPFQGHKGHPWKLSLEEEKTGMMKEGQAGETTDWWSPVSRQRRGVISSGNKRQMLKELFVALIESIVELTERLVHEACLLPLLPAIGYSLMPLSSVYWFKLCANTSICTHAGKHRYTQQLLSWIWHVFLLK